MMGILAEITVLLSSIAGVRRKLDPTPAASGSLALRARALWRDSMRFSESRAMQAVPFCEISLKTGVAMGPACRRMRFKESA